MNDTAPTKELLHELRDGVATVTLNRPRVLNTLTIAIVRELSRLLHAWADDDGVRAVVVKGAGDKAFCAGGDIRFIYDSHKSGSTAHLEFFAEEYALDHYIHRYAKPIIAVMDGIVMGGGMGIAQGAKFRICTDKTRMAMPETGIGLFPDVGGSYFLSRLEGAMGAYLGITGKELRAPDIMEIGLADYYLDPQALLLVDGALEGIKWSDDAEQDVAKALESLACETKAEPSLDPFSDAIEEHFQQATMPDIVASLKREDKPVFVDWAHKTLELMGKRSPTMMAVTLEQIQRARHLSLAECFRMELNMVYECFQQGDILEGVRALIVDKDNTPKWNPATVEEISSEQVARFFRPRWSPPNHPLASLAP